MRLLHILKSEPTQTVERFIESISGEDGAAVTVLYQEDVNWDRLVDDIFTHDKVICWW